MSKVYCNVSECTNWKKLGKTHERDYGPGYTPIGDMAEYKGECGVRPEWLQYDYFEAGTLNYSKKMAVCGHYQSSENSLYGEDLIESLTDGKWQVTNDNGQCNARPCLFNDATNDSCMKAKGDRYVDKRLTRHGNNSEELPVCTSYSDREIKGHIDLTRFLGGNG